MLRISVSLCRSRTTSPSSIAALNKMGLYVCVYTRTHRTIYVYAESERPTSPNNRPTSPNKRPTSPNKRPTSPNKRPTSPHKRPTSPNNRPTSPNKRPTSPNKRPTSPNQIACFALVLRTQVHLAKLVSDTSFSTVTKDESCLFHHMRHAVSHVSYIIRMSHV